MATWSEFAAAEPEMARLGQRILANYGIAYLGTVRPDGRPRVHPISPVILDGRIYLGLMRHTPKRHDLDRDGHCVVHTLPGPNDAEVCLTGVAALIPAEKVEELIHRAPAHVRIARDTSMYELDLERVNCTTFANVGDDQRPQPTRTRWVAEQPTAAAAVAVAVAG